MTRYICGVKLQTRDSKLVFRPECPIRRTKVSTFNRMVSSPSRVTFCLNLPGWKKTSRRRVIFFGRLHIFDYEPED